MSTVFVSNVPHNCEDAELRQWVEASGFEVKAIRVIRDLVAGVSPAFAYVVLSDVAELTAIQQLNGQSFKGRVLCVQPNWRQNYASI